MAWDFQQCGVCNQQGLRSACAYAQSGQRLFWPLDYSVSVGPLFEHNLEFLRLGGGCAGSSGSALVKVPQSWKPHVVAQIHGIYKKVKYDFSVAVRAALLNA